MVLAAIQLPYLTRDLDSKTFERALVALPRLRTKYISFLLVFCLPLKKTEMLSNFLQTLWSNVFPFLFFLTDKNDVSSSSAIDAAAAAAAKGKQPVVETL